MTYFRGFFEWIWNCEEEVWRAKRLMNNYKAIKIIGKCRDMACHVRVNTIALPHHNNQTWHATSLHVPLHYNSLPGE